MTLSAALRQRTAGAHRHAESRPFLLALADGRVTRAGVVGFLQRLLPVYEALEDPSLAVLAEHDVAPFLVPGLARSARLRADLEALGAPAGTDSPAASAYAARVRTAGTTSVPAYLGHHYTRCLGDLSGGQVVAAALRRHPDPHVRALSFLDFPELRRPAAKRAYREALDALPWSPEQLDEAVAEASLAFALSAALADEISTEVLPPTR